MNSLRGRLFAATLVSLGFRATAIDRYITKPVWIARNLDNRELLAHMEAVDDYMANMLAYPGRTFGQLYHRFFRVNELAQGKLRLTEDREIDLAEVTEPVLVVAGKSDVLAQGAVFTGRPDLYKVRLQRVASATTVDLQRVAKQWLADGDYTLEVRPFPNYQTATAGARR